MHMKKGTQTMKKGKITGSTEIYTTACHNGRYLLLFGKTNLQSFEIS